jgi:hypothetical protein
MLKLLLVPALFLLSCAFSAGCKQRDAGQSDLQDAGFSADNPLQSITVGKNVKHGEMLTFPIDPSREIEQITCKYHGVYSIRDGSKVNDEGQPYYMDGMYVHGYVQLAGGVRREVAPKKFVDAHETDNWHDLYPGARGDTLIVEMRHADKYLTKPEMQNINRTIRFDSILVKYKDKPGLKFIPFAYNANEHVSMSSDAVIVKSGGSHTVSVGADKRITRIDIRWGDEKPRVNGVYVPGRAEGAIFVNGRRVLNQRNVAAVETQVFSPISDYPAPTGAEHTVEVRFYYDDARIHWIKVYYE